MVNVKWNIKSFQIYLIGVREDSIIELIGLILGKKVEKMENVVKNCMYLFYIVINILVVQWFMFLYLFRKL